MNFQTALSSFNPATYRAMRPEDNATIADARQMATFADLTGLSRPKILIGFVANGAENQMTDAEYLNLGGRLTDMIDVSMQFPYGDQTRVLNVANVIKEFNIAKSDVAQPVQPGGFVPKVNPLGQFWELWKQLAVPYMTAHSLPVGSEMAVIADLNPEVTDWVASWLQALAASIR